MTFSYKMKTYWIKNYWIKIHLILIISLSYYCITAAESNTGLDISADQGNTNLQTAISRLQGNVILKQFDIIVKGDNAEVQAETEHHPQRYIISGSPVTFDQKSENSSLSASAGQLVYTPSNEIMEFEDSVSITQRMADNIFEITGSKLTAKLILGQVDQLDAKGNPVIFMQQLSDKKITINAEHIDWQAQSNIAILKQATVVDGETTFSADEIEYNTSTGEISASGSGETRPSYRYDPIKAKESTQSNDT